MPSRIHPRWEEVPDFDPFTIGDDHRRGPNRTVEAATEGALRFGPHRL